MFIEMPEVALDQGNIPIEIDFPKNNNNNRYMYIFDTEVCQNEMIM